MIAFIYRGGVDDEERLGFRATTAASILVSLLLWFVWARTSLPRSHETTQSRLLAYFQLSINFRDEILCSARNQHVPAISLRYDDEFRYFPEKQSIHVHCFSLPWENFLHLHRLFILRLHPRQHDPKPPECSKLKIIPLGCTLSFS